MIDGWMDGWMDGSFFYAFFCIHFIRTHNTHQCPALCIIESVLCHLLCDHQVSFNCVKSRISLFFLYQLC